MRIADYHRPRDLAEAWRLVERTPEARWVAGGTDLLVRLRRPSAAPAPVLVSLRRIAELRDLGRANGSLRIGAAVTLSEILANGAIRDAAPVLAEAVAAMGGVQVRNVGTVCGNLCNASPAADCAPPLLVLDAEAELAGPAGVRRVPLAAFFTGPGATLLAPGELLAAVRFPAPPPRARALFLKKGRNAGDIATASVAVLLVIDGRRCRSARVAAGAVGPTPLRLRAVEKLLEGATLAPALADEAAALARDAVSPIDDLRASAGYRRDVVAAFVRRAVTRLAGGTWSPR